MINVLFRRRAQSREVKIATRCLRTIAGYFGLGKPPAKDQSLNRVERQMDLLLRHLKRGNQADQILLGLPTDEADQKMSEEEYCVTCHSSEVGRSCPIREQAWC